MSSSQRLAEIEDQRAGRSIPQWRYYVALITGYAAITGARILGKIEASDGVRNEFFDYPTWWFIGIWITFGMVFAMSLVKYRRRALI